MTEALRRFVSGERLRGPAPKRWRDGTHRACPPAETLARARALMPRLGITRLANLTGLDRIGIPVFAAVRPGSRSVAVSQGKGMDADAARASALMESIETWHAEHVRRPLRLASFLEARAEAHCLDVEALPAVADSRYHPGLAMLWIEGVDLLAGRPCLVPYASVHTRYTLPLPPGHGCFPASSNGLASGNHPPEATVHALCEVIERDAVSVWHHLPAPARAARRVDPGTLAPPAAREAVDRIEAAGCEVALWDVTTDVGVAAFHCLLLDAGAGGSHLGVGSGAHPDAAVAAMRALTEAVQTRTTYISGARDDLTAAEFGPARVAARAAAARRLLAGGPPRRSFADAPSVLHETFDAELDWLLGRLRAAGVAEVAAVDLGHPDLGVSVVRVVVPGLEAPHDDVDYLPGPRSRAAQEHLA